MAFSIFATATASHTCNKHTFSARLKISLTSSRKNWILWYFRDNANSHADYKKSIYGKRILINWMWKWTLATTTCVLHMEILLQHCCVFHNLFFLWTFSINMRVICENSHPHSLLIETSIQEYLKVSFWFLRQGCRWDLLEIKSICPNIQEWEKAPYQENNLLICFKQLTGTTRIVATLSPTLVWQRAPKIRLLFIRLGWRQNKDQPG